MIKENKEIKKKFDGFAVGSFVLGLFFGLFFLFGMLGIMRDYFSNSLLASIIILITLILILSIVFGIIGLRKIKKNMRQKGKIFAVLGIIISVLLIIYILNALFLAKYAT